jgi:hypothetical protein
VISAKTLVLGAILTATVTFGQAWPRNISFNGRPLSPEHQLRVAALERAYGVRLPDGRYWYDNRSGAFGVWGGPTAAFLPAGLGLGGPMPGYCSGGGTGVFINGRELHRLDVASLQTLGPVYRGRYWLNANGDFGYEGGPPMGNLVAIANQARGGGGGGQRRVYSPGELSGVIVNEAGACTDSGCIYFGQ